MLCFFPDSAKSPQFQFSLLCQLVSISVTMTQSVSADKSVDSGFESRLCLIFFHKAENILVLGGRVRYFFLSYVFNN